MFYLSLGVCLVVAGASLLFGDGQPVPGTKMPIDFGVYKNHAAAIFLFAGILLTKLGIRSIEDESDDE